MDETWLKEVALMSRGKIQLPLEEGFVKEMLQDCYDSGSSSQDAIQFMLGWL